MADMADNITPEALAEITAAASNAFGLGFIRGVQWAVQELRNGRSSDNLSEMAESWYAAMPENARAFIERQAALAAEDPYHDV
jgi:hypothetical protein